MSRAHTQLADNKCILAGSLGSSLRLGSCQRFCWDQLGRVVLLRAGGLGFGGGEKKGKTLLCLTSGSGFSPNVACARQHALTSVLVEQVTARGSQTEREGGEEEEGGGACGQLRP